MVEKLLRGERIGELELKNLDDAIVRIEPAGGGGGISVPRENGGGASRNVYILRFDSASSGERRIQLLGLQREILKNQLVLLKSLSAIANYQVNLGTRTARVENIMRDVTLGLKDSGVEIGKIAGDVAGASAKMTDVASASADMAEEMKKMARSIDDIEGAIDNVDSMIRRMASGIESQAFSDGVAMHRIGHDIESGIGSLADGIFDESEERIVNICRAVGASTYLSGAGAKVYLDPAEFEAAGIELLFQEFKTPEYPQLYGDFEPYMGVIDVLMNCGDESLGIIRRGGK